MDYMNLNTTGYNNVVSTGQVNVTLKPIDANTMTLVIDNTDSANWLFCVSSTSTSIPTIVYPTDGTSSAGKLIPPNTSVAFSKKIGHNNISMIRGAISTAVSRINTGTGE